MPYKYFLSVCLCIKNEAKYMEEFLQHHINQGVDHFYIISNNSDDNIEEVLNYPKYKDLVTLIFDNRNMGLLTNNDGARGHKMLLNDNLYLLLIRETKWAIVVDADEFMFGKNGYTIKKYLSEVNDDINCIYVIWNIINPCIDEEGNISKTFSTKQNLKRLNYDLIYNLNSLIKDANDFGKSIVRTSMINKDNKLWIHKIATYGTRINNYGNIISNNYDNCNEIFLSEENYAKLKISLNHYAIRNFDDYIKKKNQINLVSNKKAFINGLFEMLKLSDEYLVTDNTFLYL